jgi:protein-disulfide isomerase
LRRAHARRGAAAALAGAALLSAACASSFPAPGPRLAADLTGAASRGPQDAPVTLVEFADFRCPYCRQMASVLRELSAAYPTQVRIVFKHMPIVAQDSGRAAVAAEAAGRQGRFWAMHDALFALQGRALTEPLMLQQAQALGLDVARFAADLRDPALLARVRADAAEAQRLGLSATPSLLVNGRLFTGAQTLSTLRTAVDAELAAPASAGGSAAGARSEP